MGRLSGFSYRDVVKKLKHLQDGWGRKGLHELIFYKPEESPKNALTKALLCLYFIHRYFYDCRMEICEVLVNKS